MSGKLLFFFSKNSKKSKIHPTPWASSSATLLGAVPCRVLICLTPCGHFQTWIMGSQCQNWGKNILFFTLFYPPNLQISNTMPYRQMKKPDFVKVFYTVSRGSADMLKMGKTCFWHPSVGGSCLTRCVLLLAAIFIMSSVSLARKALEKC